MHKNLSSEKKFFTFKIALATLVLSLMGCGIVENKHNFQSIENNDLFDRQEETGLSLHNIVYFPTIAEIISLNEKGIRNLVYDSSSSLPLEIREDRMRTQDWNMRLDLYEELGAFVHDINNYQINQSDLMDQVQKAYSLVVHHSSWDEGDLVRVYFPPSHLFRVAQGMDRDIQRLLDMLRNGVPRELETYSTLLAYYGVSSGQTLDPEVVDRIDKEILYLTARLEKVLERNSEVRRVLLQRLNVIENWLKSSEADWNQLYAGANPGEFVSFERLLYHIGRMKRDLLT